MAWRSRGASGSADRNGTGSPAGVRGGGPSKPRRSRAATLERIQYRQAGMQPSDGAAYSSLAAGIAFLHEVGPAHPHGSFAGRHAHVIINFGGALRMTTADRSPEMTRPPWDPRPRPSCTCTHTETSGKQRRIVELVVEPERSMGARFTPPARRRNNANPARMAVEAAVMVAPPRRNKTNLHASVTTPFLEPRMPAARTPETTKRTHEYPGRRDYAGHTDLVDYSASGNA